MFDSAKLMYNAGGGFYEHPIEQSLRFNDNDSAYLSWTPASAGNRKTWTWSGWVKRGNFGAYQALFVAGTANAARSGIWFDNSDQLFIYGEGVAYQVTSSAVYRDPSAWYHVVVAFDTTQSTASDRVKAYINGTQLTEFSVSTYPSLNVDTYVNLNTAHQMAKNAISDNYLDGYLAEVHFIDGTALDASSFGETKSGVWIPKAYSGSYGTNGFYLDFGNSGSIGADVSGNGNNFTANNLAATDVVLDSPTNNFATLNPLNTTTSGLSTLSEGNLKTNVGGTTTRYISSATQAMTSGKWYCEVYVISSAALGVGLMHGYSSLTSTSNGLQMLSNGYAYLLNGTYMNSNSTTASGLSTYSNGDVIGIMYDADVGKLEFVDNTGTKITTVAASGLDTTVSSFFAISDTSSNASSAGGGVINFGQDSSFAGNKTAQGNTDDNGYGDFYYAPPSGYLALCTANLPDPVASIDPAQDGSPQDHFNTLLYVGDGTSSNAVTGVGFQPDLVWIKNRNTAVGHSLMDAVRGADADAYIPLASNATVAESTFNSSWHSQFGGMSAIGSDGFTVFDGTDTSFDTFNGSGDTYVAWNWKANGSGVSNTDGSITSTVSANTDAGFSIVSYTGNQTAGATVGHGLSTAPSVVIIKNRDRAGYGWLTGHSGIGFTKYLVMNTTNAAATQTSIWNDTAPSSSVFTLGSDTFGNYNGDNLIAYVFSEVEGFSKFGSYTGNGSTDGTFCYCGFKPAFVMVKVTSTTQSWAIHDSKRTENNVVDKWILANLSAAEGTSDVVDILSNGFKLRTTGTAWNASGASYIFMAFAENPLKFSTAV